MRELSESILVIAPGTLGEKVRDMLTENGYDVIGLSATGNDGVRRAQDMQPALVIAACKLPDMMGTEIAENLGTFCSIILLATESQKDWIGPIDEEVIVMTYPINRGAFFQAIDIVLKLQVRIGSLTRRIHELTHSIEDKQLIERAKTHLMELNGLEEFEAHRRLQTLSMESGKRMADVARIILEHV